MYSVLYYKKYFKIYKNFCTALVVQWNCNRLKYSLKFHGNMSLSEKLKIHNSNDSAVGFWGNLYNAYYSNITYCKMLVVGSMPIAEFRYLS